MYERCFADNRRPMSLLGLALVSTLLAGCASSAERREVRLDKDVGTCTSFGASYGSPEHTQCMLAQQERRDNKTTRAMEQARIASETGRNNLEMIRQMRCDRQAKRDRKAGERPRPC